MVSASSCGGSSPEQRPEQRDVLAQRVEDEGDLERVDGAEAPAELR